MSNERQHKERDFWDKCALRYDRHMQKAELVYGIVLDFMAEFIDSSMDVLEIATGTGTLACAMADKCKSVTACDLSPEMIKVAKDKNDAKHHGNLVFHVKDAYSLDYDASSFDVAIASNVLHVMVQPEKALASIRRVLKSGGILIAPTYCHNEHMISNITSRLMSLSGFTAFHRWSAASYKDFIEKNNFHLINYKLIKGLMPFAIVAAQKEAGKTTGG
nr:class I SAM-dependent methyltransferase [uncultured Desulfobacter sp.]